MTGTVRAVEFGVAIPQTFVDGPVRMDLIRELERLAAEVLPHVSRICD